LLYFIKFEKKIFIDEFIATLTDTTKLTQ